jgi:peptidoglycan/LPS O-acetylase OafA/YrhL
LALLFAAIVIPDAGDPRSRRVVGFLESRPLVAVGVASYSVFLWHLPLIVWLADHGLTLGGWGGLLANTLIVAVPVGLLSALTYRFVEKPALRLKHSMRTDTAVSGVDGKAAKPASAGETAIAQSQA